MPNCTRSRSEPGSSLGEPRREATSTLVSTYFLLPPINICWGQFRTYQFRTDLCVLPVTFIGNRIKTVTVNYLLKSVMYTYL